MKQRLSLAFSAAAFVVAVLGVTPLGQAAGSAARDTLAFATGQAKGPLQAMGIVSRGPRGPRGRRGPRGPAGPAGPAGPTGATGATGATGPRGPQGLQGVKGDTGLQGPQGLQGDKGDTGSQGPKGDKGDTGSQGPPGPSGFTGYEAVYVQFTAVHGTWTTGTAPCPGTKRVVGGGGYTGDTLLTVTETYPYSVGSDYRGWTVRVRSDAANNATVLVFAFCVA